MPTNSALPDRNDPNYPFKLWQYLLFRDFTPPSVKPAPRILTTTALVVAGLVTFECDRLTWDYEQPKAGRGVPADGFIVWCNQGESIQSPPCGGFKLSVESRQFDMIWPDGIARSYNLAAYRNTYQGEQATDRVFDGSWINVT